MRSNCSIPGIRLLAAAAVAVSSAAVLAQPDPSGIDFVTIGAVNNAAWPGNGTPNDRAIGRGSVGYEYKIGRYEITTPQWVEFMNAAFDRPRSEWISHLNPPQFWGAASATPNTPGGLRWSVPAGNEMRAVGDISWRSAAIYCNWLHNGKSTDSSAFLNGAYDVSTFTYTGTVFNDQHTRHPDARYWIPSWDEWLKAAHYDPNKNGPGQAGWWQYSTMNDSPPAYGPPGALVGLDGHSPIPDPNGRLAEANAGWDAGNFGGVNPYTIPLGSYPGVQSPWGLLDIAGINSEWTEDIGFVAGLYPTFRYFDGSHVGGGVSPVYADAPVGRGGDFPSTSVAFMGFRIASAVPAPGAVAPLLLVFFFGRRRSKWMSQYP